MANTVPRGTNNTNVKSNFGSSFNNYGTNTINIGIPRITNNGFSGQTNVNATSNSPNVNTHPAM